MGTVRMNVTVSEHLDEYVQRRIRSGEFTTKSDFVRHLIREHAQKTAGFDIDAFVKEGVESGLSNQSPADFHKALQKKIDTAGTKSSKKKSRRKAAGN